MTKIKKEHTDKQHALTSGSFTVDVISFYSSPGKKTDTYRYSAKNPQKRAAKCRPEIQAYFLMTSVINKDYYRSFNPYFSIRPSSVGLDIPSNLAARVLFHDANSRASLITIAPNRSARVSNAFS